MSNIPSEIPAETVALTTAATGYLAKAKQFVITTPDQYEKSAGLLKEIKAQAKELETKRKSITSPMDDAKKRVMDFFRGPIDSLDQAARAINKAMTSYHEKMERERREEEERLRIEAEKEQARIDKAAEKKAAKLEAKGDIEKAEEVRMNAPIVVAPVLASQTPQVAGVSYRTVWSGEVTSKTELIKAVAAGLAPESLLDVNTTLLTKLAQAMKETMNIPGAKAVSKKVLATRS